MQVLNAARTSAEMAKRFKVDKVADAKIGDHLYDLDTMPMVEAYRGDEPVVVAMLMVNGTPNVLRAAQLLGSGFDADTLVLTTESYLSEVRENPMTGEPWGPGEMAGVAEKHDGIAKGWVCENMSTTAVNRAGDIAMITQKFRIHQAHAGFEVEWKGGAHEVSTLEEDGKAELGGRIPDMLRKFMENRGLAQVVATTPGFRPEEFGLEDPEEIRAHLDCAVIKAMYTIGGVPMALMLHAKPGSKRAEIIEHSLGDSAIPVDRLHELTEDDDGSS